MTHACKLYYMFKLISVLAAGVVRFLILKDWTLYFLKCCHFITSRCVYNISPDKFHTLNYSDLSVFTTPKYFPSSPIYNFPFSYKLCHFNNNHNLKIGDPSLSDINISPISQVLTVVMFLLLTI